MAHARTFRFGLQVSNAPTAADWAALARTAEDLGFSSLLMPDHFGDQLAPVPALQAAADATTDLVVGALVFDNDYKHPVVLAKEIATLDVLTGGRVEFGLGAGWMQTDYDQSGIAYDPPGTRIDRMVEGLAVMKGLFAEGAFSYEGKHYTVAELDGRPKPLTTPHPPIIIGGGGRRVLGIAAREADIVSINPSLHEGRIGAGAAADSTAEATDRKVGWVRDAAGARFDDLELSSLIVACIATDDRNGTAESMAGLFGVTPPEMLEIPHALIGSAEEMAADLEARRDRWGFSYFVVQQGSLDAIVPVIERLAGT